MSRLESFRRERRHKRIFKALLLAFFIFFTMGMLAADYSVNSMTSSKGRINIIRLVPNGSYLEVSFLNKKLYLNTEYVQRDINKLREYLKSVF